MFLKHFNELYKLRRQYHASEEARALEAKALDAKITHMSTHLDHVTDAINMLTRSYKHDWGLMLGRLDVVDKGLKSVATAMKDVSMQTKRTVSHLTSEAKVRSEVNDKILRKLEQITNLGDVSP